MTKQDGASSLELRQNRRDWVSAVGRWTLLTGIGATAGLLAARTGWRTCPRPTAECGSCQLLAGCRLPQARATRDPVVDPSREEPSHG